MIVEIRNIFSKLNKMHDISQITSSSIFSWIVKYPWLFDSNEKYCDILDDDLKLAHKWRHQLAHIISDHRFHRLVLDQKEYVQFLLNKSMMITDTNDNYDNLCLIRAYNMDIIDHPAFMKLTPMDVCYMHTKHSRMIAEHPWICGDMCDGELSEDYIEFLFFIFKTNQSKNLGIQNYNRNVFDKVFTATKDYVCMHNMHLINSLLGEIEQNSNLYKAAMTIVIINKLVNDI